MSIFTISFSNADTQGETFLDLGSGGGLDVFLAAKHVGPRGKCIGVDMNDKMLELAQTNATKGGYTNVQFIGISSSNSCMHIHELYVGQGINSRSPACFGIRGYSVLQLCS